MNTYEVMGGIEKEAETQSQFYNELSIMVKTKDKLKCIELLINHFNCDFEVAKIVAGHMIDNTPLISPRYTPGANGGNLNTPKCPICNSTNLTKISNVGKVVKAGILGVYGDCGKTYKCNVCGSKF